MHYVYHFFSLKEGIKRLFKWACVIISLLTSKKTIIKQNNEYACMICIKHARNSSTHDIDTCLNRISYAWVLVFVSINLLLSRVVCSKTKTSALDFFFLVAVQNTIMTNKFQHVHIKLSTQFCTKKDHNTYGLFLNTCLNTFVYNFEC